MDKIELIQNAVKRAGTAELLLGGDVCPIGRVEKRICEGGKFFSPELDQVIRAHDFFMINMEAPVCDGSIPASSHYGRGLRCGVRQAEELKKAGVTAAGLANNHILDYCAEGLFQTRKNLTDAGILCTGAGKDLEEAEEPLNVTINGLKVTIWALAEQELNCATATTPGSSFFEPARNAGRIPELRAHCDFLIIYLHAGHEFTNTPSPRIRKACRDFADAGADMVIAHHPHVIQGIEKRGNCWIAYSLGNLTFDSEYVFRHKKTKRSYMVSCTIGRHTVDRFDVIPCLISPEFEVVQPEGEEKETFHRDLAEFNRILPDDAAFMAAWEKDVEYRWFTEYRPIAKGFSEHFFSKDNLDFAIRTLNLLRCPTHLEMIQEDLRMLEEGKLSRFEEEDHK